MEDLFVNFYNALLKEPIALVALFVSVIKPLYEWYQKHLKKVNFDIDAHDNVTLHFGVFGPAVNMIFTLKSDTEIYIKNIKLHV